MVVERTSNEIIIKLPSNVNIEGVQRLLDFLVYREATARSQAKQADVDKLVVEIKKGRWAKNRKKYLP